jgi:hypothetical protein
LARRLFLSVISNRHSLASSLFSKLEKSLNIGLFSFLFENIGFKRSVSIPSDIEETVVAIILFDKKLQPNMSRSVKRWIRKKMQNSSNWMTHVLNEFGVLYKNIDETPNDSRTDSNFYENFTNDDLSLSTVEFSLIEKCKLNRDYKALFNLYKNHPNSSKIKLIIHSMNIGPNNNTSDEFDENTLSCNGQNTTDLILNQHSENQVGHEISTPHSTRTKCKYPLY